MKIRVNDKIYIIKPGASLYCVNLSNVQLYDVDLSDADLSYANFYRANLSNADLRGANLYGASLENTNLEHANLKGANLKGAYLRNVNIKGACLHGANLSDTYLPPPTEMLLAAWDHLSDELTADLMNYDAACHCDPTAFDRWANGGDCPYMGVLFRRAANFPEKKHLWNPSRPLCRPWDLMIRCFQETGVISEWTGSKT